MRAARLHEIGGTPRVDDVDAPDGENVVDVSAAGLNPVDITIGTGRFYGGSPPTPYIVGSEAVATTAGGKRVWIRGAGTVAERALSTEHTYDVPDGISDELALACGIAGLTGWLAVTWRAKVTPDDTVLVLGASGIVGSAAVQGAKALGARRVVGAARRTALVPSAADDVVELDGSYTLPESTFIVDGLWGEPAERALQAAASGVRYVQLGQSAGATATLASAWVRGKVANIFGHSLFSTPREAMAEGYRDLCQAVIAGRVAFEVEAFPLEDVASAWARQASGSPGAKIVVRV